MTRQPEEDIIRFLINNVEPLDDSNYGKGYRAAVYLTDGTFLPCVIFRNPQKTVELAIRRFSEEQKGKGFFRNSSHNQYPDIVKTFVASGNCINYYDIARVEKSRFAIPESLMREIEGETTMGWTGFAAKMKDGKYFGFGTNFHFDFFDLPDGYDMVDIEEIISHSYVLGTGEICSHKIAFSTPPPNYDKAVIYREKVFFECFLDGLK